MEYSHREVGDRAKKRMGILKRIKKRVPKDKLIIIAEAIFNSKIRYGIAVYLKPTFDREEVKMEKLSPHTKELQTVQNSMVRVILGLKQADHINMRKERKKNQYALCKPNVSLPYSHGGI